MTTESIITLPDRYRTLQTVVMGRIGDPERESFSDFRSELKEYLDLSQGLPTVIQKLRILNNEKLFTRLETWLGGVAAGRIDPGRQLPAREMLMLFQRTRGTIRYLDSVTIEFVGFLQK